MFPEDGLGYSSMAHPVQARNTGHASIDQAVFIARLSRVVTVRQWLDFRSVFILSMNNDAFGYLVATDPCRSKRRWQTARQVNVEPLSFACPLFASAPKITDSVCQPLRTYFSYR